MESNQESNDSGVFQQGNPRNCRLSQLEHRAVAAKMLMNEARGSSKITNYGRSDCSFEETSQASANHHAQKGCASKTDMMIRAK